MTAASSPPERPPTSLSSTPTPLATSRVSPSMSSRVGRCTCGRVPWGWIMCWSMARCCWTTASTPAPSPARRSGAPCTAGSARAGHDPLSSPLHQRGYLTSSPGGIRGILYTGTGGRNMPTAQVHGAEMYYEETGSGPPLILSPGGLQGALSSYQPVMAPLAQAHRVIAYDRRFGG